MITWLICMYYERKEENMIRHRRFASMQYSKVFSTKSRDKLFGAQFSQLKWDRNTHPVGVSTNQINKKVETQVRLMLCNLIHYFSPLLSVQSILPLIRYHSSESFLVNLLLFVRSFYWNSYSWQCAVVSAPIELTAGSLQIAHH